MWMYFYGTNSTTQPINMTIEGTPAGGEIESIKSIGNQYSYALLGPYAHYGDSSPTSGGKYISQYLTGDITVGSRAYIGGYTTNSDGQIFLSGNYLGTAGTVLFDVNELGNLSIVPSTGAVITIGAFDTSGHAMLNVDGNVTIGTNAYRGGIAPANGLLVEGSIVTSNNITAMGGHVAPQPSATTFAWSAIPAYSATVTNYWTGTWTNGTYCCIWSNTSSTYAIKQLAP